MQYILTYVYINVCIYRTLYYIQLYTTNVYIIETVLEQDRSNNNKKRSKNVPKNVFVKFKSVQLSKTVEHRAQHAKP